MKDVSLSNAIILLSCNCVFLWLIFFFTIYQVDVEVDLQDQFSPMNPRKSSEGSNVAHEQDQSF